MYGYLAGEPAEINVCSEKVFLDLRSDFWVKGRHEPNSDAPEHKYIYESESLLRFDMKG